MNRHLDGCYFRVERDGKWGNACFSDMTHEERDRVTEGRSVEWLKALCNYLADCLRSLGDELDIVGGSDD